MTTATIKTKLHNYIENAEQKKLRAIYTMLESELDSPTTSLTKAQINELDNRMDEYLNDTSKGMSWEDAVIKIRK